MKYEREIRALLCFASAVFLLTSLFSFYPTDKSLFFFSSSQEFVHNWCGIAGAYMASILLYIAGCSALLVPIFLIWYATIVFRHHSLRTEWDRLMAFLLCIPLCATLASLYQLEWYQDVTPGGLIGYIGASCMQRLFDAIGSMIVLYSLLAILFIVIFRLSFFSITKHAYEMLARGKTLISWLYVPLVSAYGYTKKGSEIAWQTCMTFMKDGSVVELPESIFEFDAAASLETSLPLPHEDAFWQQVQAASVEKKILSHSDDVTSELKKMQAVRIDDAIPKTPAEQKQYQIPDVSLFESADHKADEKKVTPELKERARILEEKLERFDVFGRVISIKPGSVVTLFEYEPHIDTKISKIVALEDDLAMALQALSIRIIAPIPGTSVVGFEVANQQRKPVYFSTIINSKEFKRTSAALPLILGEDTIGSTVIIDLAKMPHLLIAGSTGSGKSVALNSMLVSLLCSRTPDELKLILIDPKRLEFAAYADIPHLLFPIVTDPRKAVPILQWCVQEMEQRYEQMALKGIRNIKDDGNLSYIVVIIDELADLMMTAGREIEELLTRLSQMARAAGIHLMVATQRPSVDVITGIIKVNFTSRISFRVTSKVDSRTILDCAGADKLLGKGDMLFLDSAASSIMRVHGAYVSDAEIHKLVTHLRNERQAQYLSLETELAHRDMDVPDIDQELYRSIVQFLDEVEEVSISMLQRRFKIGYNRSARIIEALEQAGKIMPADGSKPRKVIR